MKERKNIEAQIKFDIQKINRAKPDQTVSPNGGSGSPGKPDPTPPGCGTPCTYDEINRLG